MKSQDEFGAHSKMKRRVRATSFLVVVAVCLFPVGFGGCNSATERIPSPGALSEDIAPPITVDDVDHESDLVVHPCSLDFGQVTGDTRLKGTVELTNNTDSPITLSKPKTSCGCTVANIARETIAPGESISATISFRPGGKPGRRVSKKVTFVPDGELEPVTVPVSATIVEPLVVAEVVTNESTNEPSAIRLRARDDTAFRVLASEPEGVVSLSKDDADDEHLLALTTSPDGDLPDVQQVRLTLDHPRMSSIAVPFRPKETRTRAGRFGSGGSSGREVLQVRPRRVQLGDIEFAHERTLDVLVQSMQLAPDDAPPVVHDDSPLIDVELAGWEEHTDGLLLHLVVRSLPDQMGRLRTKILLDHERGSGSLFVYGRVLPGESPGARQTSHDDA